MNHGNGYARYSRLFACLFAGLLLFSVTANAAKHAKHAKHPICDKHCLRGYTDRYVTALSSHDLRNLPLAKQVKITENGQSIKPNDGLWKSISKIGTYRVYFEDAMTRDTLFIAVVEEHGSPAIMATRLEVIDSKIAEIETIVARKGSHPLFTPELLTSADPMFTSPVVKESRSTRERMIAIANTYFDGIEKNSSKNILATPECDRFENGTKTTHRGPTSGGCAQSADAINYIKAVKNRRFFVVDEATGLVACTIIFDIPGGDPLPAAQPSSDSDKQLATTLRQARMLLLTELFKIENGKIQRIQAIMHNLPHGSGSGWEQ